MASNSVNYHFLHAAKIYPAANLRIGVVSCHELLRQLGALPLAEGEGVRSTLLTWTLGHLDTRTIGGHLDTWTLGHRTLGRQGTWTIGHLDLDTWTIGQFDNWTLEHCKKTRNPPENILKKQCP